MRVTDILDALAAGASRDEMLEDFPYLEPEDIAAAIEYGVMYSMRPSSLPL